MTPERWSDIQRLLHEVLAKPAPERDGFLDEACAGDPVLREEVVSLLSSAEEAGDFLETPVAGIEDGAGSPDATPRERIGPYRVVRELGAGGMGTVYLAVRADEQFQKRVAIKVVKRGMDTEFVLRRFRQERQILAALEHPNISRLLDGGNTEDGLPYFVMEYVEGEPITRFCERNTLGVPERLRLFRTVCGAVHFAHQNLVVHRDLKPGNILVTAEGVPKLLDFGIAKLLNPELAPQTIDMTAASLRLFTPDHASPEQIRGERITTSSDVYSLGVLLYELLAGRLPYRTGASTEEIAKAVCDEEPEKPSTAVTRPGAERTSGADLAKQRRLLTGDLDMIVLKAMRKEPQRRYASVEQFSEDIRRYLEGLPVVAGRDTFSYRAGKFLRRHKAGAAAAALVLVTLLGGIATTSWQARIARREKERADRRFNEVRQLANSFLFELHDAIESLPGSTLARDLLVRRALEYLGTLAKESASDPSLQRELATAYEKVGAIQAARGEANLGDTAGSLASYRAALRIREGLAAANPKNLDDLAALAHVLEALAGTLASAGDAAESLGLSKRATAMFEGIVATDPKNRASRWSLARSHFILGSHLSGPAQRAERLREMEQSLAMYEALSAEDPKDVRARRAIALCSKNIASLQSAIHNQDEALAGYRKSLAIETELLAADPTNAVYRRDLSHSYGGIGEVLFRLGQVAAGAESYEKAIAIRKELADADPKNVGIREALARGHLNLGSQHAYYGDPRAAIGSLERALQMLTALSEGDSQNSYLKETIAGCFLNLGVAHERIAEEAGARSERARAPWLKAHASYLKSHEIAAALETKGKLSPNWGKQEVEAALVRCDLALAGRPYPPRPPPLNM